jgi:hypothetical protein
VTRLLLAAAILTAVVAAPAAASACAVPPRHPTRADRAQAAGLEGDMWRSAPLVYLATVAEVGGPGESARLTPTLLLKGDGLPEGATMPQGRALCPRFIGPEMAVGDEYVVYAFPMLAGGQRQTIFARADDLGDPATRQAVARARRERAR